MGNLEYFCPECNKFVSPLLTSKGFAWINDSKGHRPRENNEFVLSCYHRVIRKNLIVKESRNTVATLGGCL